jgi:hypothetical protein
MSAKTIDMPDVSTDQRIAPASPMELLIGALRKADAGQLAQLLDVNCGLRPAKRAKPTTRRYTLSKRTRPTSTKP